MIALHLNQPETPTQPTCSRFPGVAYKHFSPVKFADVIDLIKGEITYVSPRTQTVVPKAKYTGFYTNQIHHLIGNSYLYWCEKCHVSVITANLPNTAAMMAAGVPYEKCLEGPRCPHCWNGLSPVKVGDKVLLHFRYASDGVSNGKTRSGSIRWRIPPSWAEWFAERYDW
jgi:hypothetical protein